MTHLAHLQASGVIAVSQSLSLFALLAFLLSSLKSFPIDSIVDRNQD
jgi:hypothetical protein